MRKEFFTRKCPRVIPPQAPDLLRNSLGTAAFYDDEATWTSHLKPVAYLYPSGADPSRNAERLLIPKASSVASRPCLAQELSTPGLVFPFLTDHILLAYGIASES
jgi:hypothetical protein